jgi:hemerythrin-like domain-containing protein
MPDIMKDLHEHHVNVALVLRLGNAELDALEQGSSADYTLLEDIMSYVTGFSDTHHHPTEDIVFARVVERAPESAGEIEPILAEHDALIEKGRLFYERLEAVREDAMVRRDELVAAGREYFSQLHKHMSAEETRLFPLAMRTLAPEDWGGIEQRIVARADPLFGASRDESFRRLWQRIEAHETRD